MPGQETLKEEAIRIIGDEPPFVLKPCRIEKDVKAEVRRYLKRYEPMWIFMPVQSGYGVTGTPDFVGCYRGCAFGIECKFGSNKSSEIQLRQQSIMASAGAAVFEVSEKTFHTFIHDWEKFVLRCGGMVK